MAGMRFETSQSMKLGQTMSLSPRLIQSAEILQLNAMELGERLEQEVEKNVALELVMPGTSDEVDQRRGPREEAPQGGGATEFERLRRLERQYGDQWNSDGDSRRAVRDNRERDAKMDAMANTPSRGMSLADHLLEQWRFAEVHDPAIRAAGARLIEYVDDDGLLTTPLETVREQSARRSSSRRAGISRTRPTSTPPRPGPMRSRSSSATTTISSRTASRGSASRLASMRRVSTARAPASSASTRTRAASSCRPSRPRSSPT